jgi:glycosyltransferase involved in cell wall biosynthesis
MTNTTYPLVSIVTPAYNQAEYLAETIESVLAQDYPNLEYIVLDDGSSDETPAVLQRYNGRIQHDRHSNMGQARTLNKGWQRARGTYLGYLSSDDLLYPSAVRQLVALLESDSSIVCVFPDANLIDDRSRVTKKNVCRPFDLDEIVVRQECYIGPGALFRRSAFEIVGGWRAELKLAPDREFWIRIASQGRVEMLPSVLAGYRLHPQSISYKDVAEEVGREYLLVLNEYYSSGDVSPETAARKDEAYGYANLLLARNSFRAGQFKRGLALYREACNLHSALRSNEVKIKILRNIFSKPLRTLFSAARSLVSW